MSSSTTSRLQLLLTVVTLLVCSSIGPLSTVNAIEMFPDSASRGAVVGQVVAPQVDDVAPRSFTRTAAVATTTTTAVATTTTTAAATAATLNLRREASDVGSASSDVSATVLPGENGFGHVSYNSYSNAAATPSASDSSSSTVVESQVAYRARIRKAEKEAERKYPHLRLQNLISL